MSVFEVAVVGMLAFLTYRTLAPSLRRRTRALAPANVREVESSGIGRGEVDNYVMTRDETIDQRRVADVSQHERVTGKPIQLVDGGLHSGIGEQIQIRDRSPGLGLENVADEVGPDEPRTPGYQIPA